MMDVALLRELSEEFKKMIDGGMAETDIRRQLPSDDPSARTPRGLFHFSMFDYVLTLFSLGGLPRSRDTPGSHTPPAEVLSSFMSCFNHYPEINSPEHKPKTTLKVLDGLPIILTWMERHCYPILDGTSTSTVQDKADLAYRACLVISFIMETYDGVKEASLRSNNLKLAVLVQKSWVIPLCGIDGEPLRNLAELGHDPMLHILGVFEPGMHSSRRFPRHRRALTDLLGRSWIGRVSWAG
ncbi:hypothetical protein CC2G_008230 [Coprinopsis cinerea AmutBmut pab1-1]|nr:hypothetical protein CC2G_008230 [Coprinopsis cinerea AmutBmut pab1-1]